MIPGLQVRPAGDLWLTRWAFIDDEVDVSGTPRRNLHRLPPGAFSEWATIRSERKSAICPQFLLRLWRNIQTFDIAMVYCTVQLHFESWRIEGIAATVFGMATNAQA
jgi:hypothetical protein